MDLSERRELNNGAGDTLARAFELALTPAIFAGLGLLIDRRLGTFPLVMLVLFAFVMTYEIWKMFGNYSAAMKREEQKLLGRADAAREDNDQ